MTTTEFRKFLKHSAIEGYKFENHVSGEVVYEETSCPVSICHPRGTMTLKKFVPYTNSNCWADHKVYIRLPHSNYMWFNIYLTEKGVQYIFDYVWKAGPGKMMSRDGGWNLYWSMFDETNS